MRLALLAGNIRAKLVIMFFTAAFPLVAAQVAIEVQDRDVDLRLAHARRLESAEFIAGYLNDYLSELKQADRDLSTQLCGRCVTAPDQADGGVVLKPSAKYPNGAVLMPDGLLSPLAPGRAADPAITQMGLSGSPTVVTHLRSKDGTAWMLCRHIDKAALRSHLPLAGLRRLGEAAAILDECGRPVLAEGGSGPALQGLLRGWRSSSRRRRGLDSAVAPVPELGWTVVVSGIQPHMAGDVFSPKRLVWLMAGLLLGSGILYAAGTRVSQRIRRLALAASAISVGDYRKRVSLRTGDEFEMLASALNSVGERLVRDHGMMKRQADLLCKMAEAARISSSSLDIRECARAVAKAVCLQLGARDSAVFHKRPSGGDLRIIGYCGRRCRASWKLIAKHTVDSGQYLTISERTPVEGQATDSQAVLVGIPLRRNDAVIGAIVARYEGGVRKNDLKLGSMRSDVLRTFGIHAAAAIGNADAYSETERASEALQDSVDRLSSVVLVTDAIAPSLTLNETLTALAKTTATLLDVDLCTIFLSDGSGRLSSRGTSAGAGSPWENLTLPAHQSETGKAFHGRRTVLCTEAHKSRYATTRQAAQDFGFRSIMSTPLVAQGETIGAISVYTTEPRRFTPREIDLLESISHHAAFIVRNASLYTKEYSIAESLQRSLMSEIPGELNGLRFAGRYIPVPDEASVGGDFYEVSPLPNGKVGVVIADVSGKGLAAAMHLAASKFTMKSFAFMHPDDPAAVLRDLNDAINYYFDLSFFVTMFYCVIDPQNETLVYASAGHLPGIVISSSGRLHSDLASTGTPIGSGQACCYTNRTFDFGPGDTLLLYTDGVTDLIKNGAPLDIEGLHSLVFEAGRSSASELVDYVCKELDGDADSHRKDDIALLAVKFEGIALSQEVVGGTHGHEIRLPDPAI